MPPRPKPTALKIATGTRNNRINFKEPKFKKVSVKDSDPPENLCEMAAAEWNRVFKELKDAGVLVKLNRNVLAGYCAAYANWKKAQLLYDKSTTLIFKTPNGAIQQIPYVSIVNNSLLCMLKYAVEFGMTPSSRSRIIAKDPAEDGDNKLLNFLMGDKPNARKE